MLIALCMMGRHVPTLALHETGQRLLVATNGCKTFAAACAALSCGFYVHVSCMPGPPWGCFHIEGRCMCCRLVQGGAVFGGYNPLGYDGFGTDKSSMGAFLFTWPDGGCWRHAVVEFVAKVKEHRRILPTHWQQLNLLAYLGLQPHSLYLSIQVTQSTRSRTSWLSWAPTRCQSLTAWTRAHTLVRLLPQPPNLSVHSSWQAVHVLPCPTQAHSSSACNTCASKRGWYVHVSCAACSSWQMHDACSSCQKLRNVWRLHICPTLPCMLPFPHARVHCLNFTAVQVLAT